MKQQIKEKKNKVRYGRSETDEKYSSFFPIQEQ